MKFLFIILALFIILNLKANDSDFFKKQELVFKEAKHYKLENISNINTKIVSNRFVVEKIIDNRFDNLFSGIYSISKNKLIWVDGISKSLIDSIFLATDNIDTVKNKVILVVNDLWFFDSQTRKKDKLNSTPNDNDIGDIKLGIKLHTYVQKNGLFYPLSLIDTNILGNTIFNVGVINLRELFTIAMILVKKNIENNLAKNLFNLRKPIAFSELNNRYKNNITTPKIEKKINTKGVYNTYADFLNNLPATDSFSIEFDKKRPHSLYIKEKNGLEYLSRNTWGVFDGKNLWINDNGFLFPLFKISKTYYWLGVDIDETKSWIYLPIPYNFSNGGFDTIHSDVNVSKVNFRSTVFRLHPHSGEKNY
jgi:hypothetical protein